MGLFNPLVQEPIVKVRSGNFKNRFIISWPAQSDATGFKVYAGFDPLSIRSLISGTTALPVTPLEFTFNAPFYPPGQAIYFWVAKVTGGGDVFLTNDGSTIFESDQINQFEPSPLSATTQTDYICSDDQQYFFEEIRRRSLAVLEDTGENVLLFIKQWTGVPDPTAQDALDLDPNYQTMTRDDRTYGAGFFPGFFPAITVRMRFGGLPAAFLDYQAPALRPLLENEAWTTWDPILHEHDLLVRPSNGLRYTVNNVSRSNFRSVSMIQRANLEIVNPTSPMYKITDADIRDKWTQVNSADFSRLGFGTATDTVTGGPDFILFS